ncbi:MAG: hypothetical protein ACK4NS_12710 [Saprospiraceae bacterium]
MLIMRKLTLIAALICCAAGAMAQYTATWKGGKPGQATEWNIAANWKEGRVPDEFTQVIIPASAAHFPVISRSAADIDALMIESGAQLTILASGSLTITGETGRYTGAANLGIIDNQGMLIVNIPDWMGGASEMAAGKR